MKDLYKQVRRVAIGVIGFTVLLIGVVMIVLPGPAIIVIPLGLAILATEFIWARRLLNRVRGQLKDKTLLPFRWFKQRYL
jgi:tellurite resistance protein TerC